MSTPARVLAIARDEMGTKEVPYGSNRGGRVYQYQQTTWLGGSGWPWCVAYCQWTFKQAHIPFPWLGAGAYAMLDWARKAGWAKPLPMVGDIAVFNIGSGHVGIVESFSGETVVTIDGNVSHSVDRRRRPRSSVRGYVRHPKLHDQAASTPTVKPPLFEVVGSESGHSKVLYVGRKKAVAGKLGTLFNRYGGLTVRKRKKA